MALTSKEQQTKSQGTCQGPAPPHPFPIPHQLSLLQVQSSWSEGAQDVVVATIAFGMGRCPLIAEGA